MPAPSWDAAHWGETTTSGTTLFIDGTTPAVFAGENYYDYGDISIAPTGGWEVGFRAAAVVIDVYAPNGFYDSGYGASFYISDGSSGAGASLLGVTFPLTIPLTELTGDINYLSFDDVHAEGYPVTILSITFIELGPDCWWTSKIRVTEECD
jgi:hypothetical protein